MGELGILNVGTGDTKLTFDKTKPEETKRAAAIVTDMLKRGFAILVEVGKDEKGPLYRRATAFDPETMEYIIVGLPEDEIITPKEKEEAPQKRRGRPLKRVPADSTNAISVSRSAGG